jgi:hypothetical protein
MKLRSSLLLLGMIFVSANALAVDKSKSQEVFERLASLEGEWEGEQKGTQIHVTCTLTANGSALMEQFRPNSGPAMITMFTVDGDRLIATHYCSARNQPQMVTSAITNVHKPLAFVLTHITGLKSRDDWHNTALTLIQEDKDHVIQQWTYQSKGKIGKTIFRYTRIRQ